MGAAFAAGALAVLFLERCVGYAQRARPAGRLPDTPDADARLREHVRSCLDGWVSHPRAIAVEVQDRVVRVSGQVLPGELESLLMHLAALPGVYKVRNALSALRDPQTPY